MLRNLDPPFLSLFSMSFTLPLTICLVSWIPRIPVLCSPVSEEVEFGGSTVSAEKCEKPKDIYEIGEECLVQDMTSRQWSKEGDSYFSAYSTGRYSGILSIKY